MKILLIRNEDTGIFLGAKEIAGDNIDQDCNYMDRTPYGGKDAEVPIKY